MRRGAVLERPTAGEILYDGVDIAKLERKQLLSLRRRIQIIFQDPYSSLNPRMKVGEIIAEPIMVHGIERDAARRGACARASLDLRPRSEIRRPLPPRDRAGRAAAGEGAAGGVR